MTAMKICILCFNEFEEEGTYCDPSTPKLPELCCKYLHSSLTQELSVSHSNNLDVPHCPRCFESMMELHDLHVQLEFYQKRISELVFIRSLEILHRRAILPDCSNQNGPNYTKLERNLIEFDVSALPNCDFRKTYSDVPESTATLAEGCHNFLNIKVDNNEFDFVDESNAQEDFDDDLFIENTKQNSDISVGDTGSKGQNPILKLQKLNFCDSDQKVILVENEQNNFGEEKGKMKVQSVWTKSNSDSDGRYKRTAVIKIQTSDNCSSIHGDQDYQLKPLIDQTVLDDETFQTEQELADHGLVDSEEPPNNCDKSNIKAKHKTYKCHVCKEIFTSKVRFLSHKIKIHHQGKWPFKCDVCRKGFFHQSAINLHRRMHTDERPFVCEVCGKGFKKKSHLVTHRRFHTGEKPYKCEICGKRYTQIGSLIVHKGIHTGERPYKCEVCGKGFTYESSLSTHIKIHAGEKPFKCEVCGKGFTYGSNLVTHKNIHAGEKPFNCEVCGKGFVYKSSLSTHIKIHAGEKPFNCQVCDKGFVQKTNMLKHKCQKDLTL